VRSVTTTTTTYAMLAAAAAVAALATVARGIDVPPTKTLPVPKERSWREFDEKGAVDPRNELKEVTLRIGPFGPIAPHRPGTDTQSGPTGDWSPELARPEPDKDIEVAAWWDWVLTWENGTEIPRTDLYFHHILAYSQGTFMTGCSSERTTWGVDHLPYPYRQVLRAGQRTKAGGFHFNNMSNSPKKFYVQYRMLYKVHVPTDPAVRVVNSFYWMDNYNVPGHAAIGETHRRNKFVHMPRDAVVVSLNGHLHQGGEKLVLRVKETGEEICVSRNVYNASVPCYWDCPDICPYQPHGWTAQWGTTTCYMERAITKATELESYAIYDNSCAWRGVMAWWFGWMWTGQQMGDTAAAARIAAAAA